MVNNGKNLHKAINPSLLMQNNICMFASLVEIGQPIHPFPYIFPTKEKALKGDMSHKWS